MNRDTERRQKKLSSALNKNVCNLSRRDDTNSDTESLHDEIKSDTDQIDKESEEGDIRQKNVFVRCVEVGTNVVT